LIHFFFIEAISDRTIISVEMYKPIAHNSARMLNEKVR